MLRRGLADHQLTADRQAEPADAARVDVRARREPSDGGLQVAVAAPAPGVGVAVAFALPWRSKSRTP